MTVELESYCVFSQNGKSCNPVESIIVKRNPKQHVVVVTIVMLVVGGGVLDLLRQNE